jgi:glycosyltransferase involved in cell wall biosynthesis
MLTIHLLTKNNQKTIKSTLESIYPYTSQILIGDYGSTDDTIDICKSYQAKIFNVKGLPRNEARSLLLEKSKNDWNLWIEPWEILLQNPLEYKNLKENFANVRILNGQIIIWNVRLWKNKCTFVNPIYERIQVDKASYCNLVISSHGRLDPLESMAEIQKWKLDQPMSSQPYYYQACLQLAEGQYEDFLKSADYYLFSDKQLNISSIMTRYYYAMVQLMQKKNVKPALQNLNICLCAKPLMAEFWCLTGDVYYHLLHKFSLAKEFYENAIILGSKRLALDSYPMDISKYNKYPKMMIESCEKLITTNSDYLAIK